MNYLNGVLLHSPYELAVECVVCLPVRSLCIVYERQVKLKLCIHDFDLIPVSRACDVHHYRRRINFNLFVPQNQHNNYVKTKTVIFLINISVSVCVRTCVRV